MQFLRERLHSSPGILRYPNAVNHIYGNYGDEEVDERIRLLLRAQDEAESHFSILLPNKLLIERKFLHTYTL